MGDGSGLGASVWFWLSIASPLKRKTLHVQRDSLYVYIYIYNLKHERGMGRWLGQTVFAAQAQGPGIGSPARE